MEVRLDGKVALVTGATGGIGRAVAIALAASGARVVVAGRRQAAGETTVRQIEDAGGRARFVTTDVAEPEQIGRLVEDTVDTWGRLDCAVNNAGVLFAEEFAQATVEVWEQTLQTNARGVLLCMRHEFAAMSAAGGGAIVNVSAVAGFTPNAFAAIYGASKAAVSHLTQCGAREFGPSGVRVNEIVPAMVMSEMVRSYFEGPGTPSLADSESRLALRRAGHPDEAAAACVFLCSEAASFITGASLPVDGGWLLYNAA